MPRDTFPGFSLDFNGWQKPTKFAHRCSLEKKAEFESGDGKATELGKLFVVLADRVRMQWRWAVRGVQAQ